MEAAGGAGVGAGLPTAAHWLVPGPRTPLARGAALAGSRREAREREPAARPPACRGVQGGWVPIRSWTLPSRLPPSPALRLRIHRRNQDSSKWEPWKGGGWQPENPLSRPCSSVPTLGDTRRSAHPSSPKDPGQSFLGYSTSCPPALERQAPQPPCLAPEKPQPMVFNASPLTSTQPLPDKP